MFRWMLISLFSFVAFASLHAADKINGVKTVAMTFEPTEAKPGETVLMKLTVELNAKHYTYPLVQTDPGAVSMVNKIDFPKPGSLIFVGDALDPADPKSKAEPLLNIEAMLYYTGKVVYERRVVVSPMAKPGEVTVALPQFLLSVCNEDNCFPPKKLTPEAKFKVLDGPAVEVHKRYAKEVEKALAELKDK